MAGRFLRIFALALLSMSFLYVLIDYLEISESIVKNRIGAGVVLAYYQALLAPILLDLVPFAFLVAALITTAGLVRSGEATALLAHGLSLFRMAASLLLFAAATGVVLFFYAERVVPRAAADADRYRARILKHPEPAGSAATRWFRGQGGRFLSGDAYDPASRGLAGLSVVELDPATFQMTSRTSAAVGQVVPGRGILAEDGWMRSFGPDGSSLFMAQEGRFFVDAPEAGEGFATAQSDPRQMTVRQLARFIDGAPAGRRRRRVPRHESPPEAGDRLLGAPPDAPRAPLRVPLRAARGRGRDRRRDPARPLLLLRDVAVRQARRGGRPPARPRRLVREHPLRPRGRATASSASGPEAQVPSSQPARYFSCAGVSRSIRIPIEASLSRAISASIAAGIE